jgi:hypothetical protein
MIKVLKRGTQLCRALLIHLFMCIIVLTDYMSINDITDHVITQINPLHNAIDYNIQHLTIRLVRVLILQITSTCSRITTIQFFEK